MLTRLLLRFSALGLKFALAIVLARTLGFDAVAAYGLAVAASVIASKVLGLGFSQELNRRLSGADPLPAIREARALCAGYGGLYLLLVAILAAATASGAVAGMTERFGLSTSLVWCVVLVALSEHAALETNAWIFSLHRPRAGSLLLFVRTGAWAGIACAGLLTGLLHTIEAVFMMWIGCNALVVLASWRCIGALARRIHGALRTECRPSPRDVFKIWRQGLPFYVAGVILSTLQYAERFIAGGHVGADALGRYVFAWSIANAVQTVAFATVVVMAGPRFVRTLADAPGAFTRQVTRATAVSVAVTILASAVLLVMYRDVFRLAHESAAPDNLALLAVLLASFVLRSAADVLWSAAIALRSGIIVMGSMAALAALYLPLAWQLIGHAGVVGAAMAHLAASIGIVALLALVVARGRQARATAAIRKVASHAA